MPPTSHRLAYGYLRVLPGMGIDDVLRLQRDLVVFAENNRLVLADVFVEAKWQQLNPNPPVNSRSRART